MNEYRIITASTLILFLIIALVLAQIQVLNQDYALESRNNVVQKLELKSVRGLILSRRGQILVNNSPVFDLTIVPRLFSLGQKSEFCELFQISDGLFDAKFAKAKRYSSFKPSIILEDLDFIFVNQIIDKITNFTGLNLKPKFVRNYPRSNLALTLGYIGQIDARHLDSDSAKYYVPDDLIGKSGLEYQYEAALRGKKGFEYVVKDVKNIIKTRFQAGIFDKALEEGYSLRTSIDLDLQTYSDSLMKGFKGAVVALEPKTGSVLTMTSAPDYDPQLLTGAAHENSYNYAKLQQRLDLPLFNRAIMARYPPGSTLKPLVALLSLAAKRLDTTRTYYSCNRNLVACHGHPAPVNLKRALRYSCNPYFYQVLRDFIVTDREKDLIEQSRKGLTAFQTGLQHFGLGKNLGIDLPFEVAGVLPSVDLYDRSYKNKRWKYNNYYSIAIGQGEVGLTPLQLANVAAILANRGWYRQPQIVTHIDGQKKTLKPKQYIPIDSLYFAFVAKAMSKVVQGTAGLAAIPNLILAGKTGTAQNPHGKDHSVFIAFAPYEKPEIAIAVYVENVGLGGSVAAPIASLIIEKYLKGKIDRSRVWLDSYIQRKKAEFKADSLRTKLPR